MYICVFAHVCVSMHICVFVCAHSCVYVCMHMHVHACLCMRVHTHERVYAYKCMHMCVHTHVCACMCVHTCMCGMCVCVHVCIYPPLQHWDLSMHPHNRLFLYWALGMEHRSYDCKLSILSTKLHPGLRINLMHPPKAHGLIARQENVAKAVHTKATQTLWVRTHS